MLDAFVDFETRSKTDLKKHGQPLYAADPSTIPLMMAYGLYDTRRLWRYPEPFPHDLQDLIDNPEVVFHAWNAAFEIYIWRRVCVPRLGWPDIPNERWYCTMGRAAAANLPQFLDGAVKRLGLPEEFQKDGRGKELIQALSLPTKLQATYQKNVLGEDGKPLKVLDENGLPTRRNQKQVNRLSKQYAEEIGADIFTLPGKPGEYFFREDEDLMQEFGEYCVQDIVAEKAADDALPPIPDHERETWLLDREINERGFPIDRDLCEAVEYHYNLEVDDAVARLDKITGGFVTSGGQVAKIKEYVLSQVDTDYFDEGLEAEAIDAFLARYDGHPERWDELKAGTANIEDAIDVLKIRKLVGGAAVKKYFAALAYADADDRCREQLRYHRASTGRWGGSGVQPHNFKRVKTPDEEVFETIKLRDWELLRMYSGFAGKSVPDLLTDCVRGLILAPKDKTFIVSDFAGIEGRVLNWLVGNEYKLDLYRKGEDTYVHAAIPVYFNAQPGTPEYQEAYLSVTEIDPETNKRVIQAALKYMRQMGKAQELGLGYGMAWRTFRNGAIRAGQDMEEDFAKNVVSTWRETNPEVPQFWWDLDAAATKVVKAGRRQKRQLATTVGKVTIGYDPNRKFMIIRIPSGRNLYYYDPVIRQEEDNFGRMRDNLYYWDGKKNFTNTYGGKLTENIVQALARDLLVYSMKIIAAAGIPIAFHVHDEAVAEVLKAEVERFYPIVHKAMETTPDWADGLPLEAETYVSERYRK